MLSLFGQIGIVQCPSWSLDVKVIDELSPLSTKFGHTNERLVQTYMLTV